ncbi:MAG: hypothetical protein IT453_12010 [Planctomycetes bacterium]|nr:hypothetical protein [Planctomycetota bacterium]
MFLRTSIVAVVASLALAAGCSSPKKSDAAEKPDASGARAAGAEDARPIKKKQPDKPWTTAFGEKAALVGDEVTIEGPPGLLEHVLVLQNSEFFTHEERATPDGFLQLTAVKPDVGGAPPIRLRIDAWTIDAMVSVRVLERPGEVPVVVQVSGEAWYKPLAGDGEQRSAVLRFVGQRP